MGKKRNKRRKSNSQKRSLPQYLPSIQHQKMLENIENSIVELYSQLEKDVRELQSLISQHSPLDIAYNSAMTVIPCLLHSSKDIDLDFDAAIGIPTAEYLHYLISRTTFVADPEQLSQDSWNDIWNRAVDILRKTQMYLLSKRIAAGKNNSPIEEFAFEMELKRLLIRVRTYPYFLENHLHFVLDPYKQELVDYFGIDSDAICAGILTIRDYLIHGYPSMLQELKERHESFIIKINHLIDSSGSASPYNQKELYELCVSQGLATEYNDLTTLMKNLLSSAAFDITGLSGLPMHLLSELSIIPGEAPLHSLTGDNHDDLSPLYLSKQFIKPLISIDSSHYALYHSGIEDSMGTIIENIIFKKYPDRKESLTHKRSDATEAEAVRLLHNAFSPECVYRNVHYPNPDGLGGEAEIDAIMLSDDVLFLIEVKSGSFSASAARGAPRGIESDIGRLVIEARNQLSRAYRYIIGLKEAIFSDEKGATACRISRSNYRQVYSIIVTREDCGFIGSQIGILDDYECKNEDILPLLFSIEDLRVICDVFSGKDLEFVHYLKIRSGIARNMSIRQLDELDHLGLYLKANNYELLIPKDYDMTTFMGYTENLDDYYMNLMTGVEALKPSQGLPKEVIALFNSMRIGKTKGRFHFAEMVLDGNSSIREVVGRIVQSIYEDNKNGKKRSYRIPVGSKSKGFTITALCGNEFKEEIKMSCAHSLEAGFKYWLIVRIAKTDPLTIGEIRYVDCSMYNAKAIMHYRIRAKNMIWEQIIVSIMGGKDACPCGSGKSVEKCHGRKQK